MGEGEWTPWQREIVAVGMLVDNSVVVIETTARHLTERGGDIRTLAAEAASEVTLPILGGTLTTIAVLLPVMFAGGFVETILRPFAVTLVLAIASSYLVAVTVIPLMAPAVLRRHAGRRSLDERWAMAVGNGLSRRLAEGAWRVARWAIGHRGLTLLITLVAALLSLRVAPFLGRNLMPPWTPACSSSPSAPPAPPARACSPCTWPTASSARARSGRSPASSRPSSSGCRSLDWSTSTSRARRRCRR